MMGSFSEDDLQWSEQQANAPWWEEVYRQAFPDMVSMQKIPGPSRAQENGVDRLIFLGRDKVVRVDEKTRRKDWDDILLELLSCEERKTPGWLTRPLTADFIAYAFEPSRRCYLLPVLQLQRAWRLNGAFWSDLATRAHDGFSFRRGSTGSNGGGVLYHALNIVVPTDALLDAIRGALLIRWGA
jgi:hypothetical protein